MTAGSGTPVRNPYGPDEAHYESIRDLTTPEKYAVYYNGSASPPRIYIQVSATQWERFDKDTSAPGDWSTDERFDTDSDNDGVLDAVEANGSSCVKNATGSACPSSMRARNH